MKNFKNFQTLLFEAAEKTEDYAFHLYPHIPLSKKMIQRIEGQINLPLYAVHITSIDNVKTLIEIQNSARQISAMTDPGGMLRSLIEGGVATEGGVWTIIHGYPVISAARDFWTKLDKQGRKWMSLEKLRYQAKHTDDPEGNVGKINDLLGDIYQLKKEILVRGWKIFKKDEWLQNFAYAYAYDLKSEKFSPRDFQVGKQNKLELYWSKLKTIDVSRGQSELSMHAKYAESKGIKPGDQFMHPTLKITKKAKGWIIKQYFDGLEKLLKKGGYEAIKGILANPGDDYGAWDEISLNNFRIELMGATNSHTGKDLEEIGKKNNIPVDAVYGEEPVDEWEVDAYTTTRLKEYFAAVKKNTMADIMDLVDDAILPSERTVDFGVDKFEVDVPDLKNPNSIAGLLKSTSLAVVPYWNMSGDYLDYITYKEWRENSAFQLFPSTFRKGDLVNPFLHQQTGAIELTGFFLPYKPNMITQEAFSMWREVTQKNAYNIMIKTTMGGSAAAYGLAIAYGVFGDVDAEQIVSAAVESFTKFEDSIFES
tara:strand:- start:395 stop:2005 length:1611 start_codon:yes stop_codon:yes gene_type:complete